MASAHEASTVSAISLDGPSVRLRPITRADYGFLWECRTHPEILYLWMQGRTLPTFEQYTQELDGALSSKFLTTLLIETRQGGNPLGYVFAYDFSAFDHTAFISIVIHPAYVQYGWAAQASVLFLNYLFTYFDLRKVSLELFAFNQLAMEPLLRLGAHVEGRFRGQRYYQGAYHDVIRLAVMHEDWDQIGPILTGALARPTDDTNGASPSNQESEVSDVSTETLVEAVPRAARNGRSTARSRGSSQRNGRRGETGDAHDSSSPNPG